MEDFTLYLCMLIDGKVRSVYSVEQDGLFEYTDSQISAASIPDTFTKSKHQYEEYHTHILMIKPFIDELSTSACYRNFVLLNFKEKRNLSNKNVIDRDRYFVIIEAELIKSYVIDYTWGWMLWRDCHMGLERECAAAWLSTLGGAFSALGDNSSKFASRALQTSIQQLKLARICQDDNGIARGWLFLALALSQLGFRSYSNMLLLRAWTHPSFDPRHRNMCLGVQAKLRYDMKTRQAMSKAEKSILVSKRNKIWESLKNLSL